MIGLAPNLFYGTGFAACLLVLRKKKPAVRRGKVLSADASALFRKGQARNFLEKKEPPPRSLATISGSRRCRIGHEGIEKEGWTLNISRYVLPPVGADTPLVPAAVAAFQEALGRCREAEGWQGQMMKAHGHITQYY
ncbi:N-6 DNA methylase [Sorangium sp. So ce381]|uniref:N-6 DNA methylase n=1 Tax=Sorangium sp. So ce381 TaxID=3133307 RepID=UPI003F5C3AFA